MCKDWYYTEDEIPAVVEDLLNCYEVPEGIEAADLKSDLLYAECLTFAWAQDINFTMEEEDYE